MNFNFTRKTGIALLFSFFAMAAKTQTNIAQQTAYNPGWYSMLCNYYDSEGGWTEYDEQGQTFKSSLTTVISSLDFMISGFSNPGAVNVEIYSCSSQTGWGTLLGTKTNVSITGNGWFSANLLSLNVHVTAGNYYGFKLIPQSGLFAGIAVKSGSGYTDGAAWWGDGMGGEYFDGGDDAPFRIIGSGVLAAEFMSFTAVKQNENVLLNWSTAQQVNNKNYVVKHSTNGSTWASIGAIPAGPVGTGNYSFVHASPAKGSNYYRIQQVDLDEKFTYSNIRIVRFADDSKAIEIVSSNPVKAGSLQIRVNIAGPLSFYNADGKLLWKKQAVAGVETINVNGYAKGVYFLRSGRQAERVVVE